MHVGHLTNILIVRLSSFSIIFPLKILQKFTFQSFTFYFYVITFAGKWQTSLAINTNGSLKYKESAPVVFRAGIFFPLITQWEYWISYLS